MLEEMPAGHFIEQMAYAQLEPFGREEDVRFARLMCLLANINRDPKRRAQPYGIEDFLPGERKRRQTPEQQGAILRMIFPVEKSA